LIQNGLEVRCWHAGQKEFYDAEVKSVVPRRKATTKEGNSKGNKEGGGGVTTIDPNHLLLISSAAYSSIKAKEGCGGGDVDLVKQAAVSAEDEEMAKKLLGSVRIVWSGEDEEEEVPALYLRSASEEGDGKKKDGLAGGWPALHKIFRCFAEAAAGASLSTEKTGEAGADAQEEEEEEEELPKTAHGVRFIFTLKEMDLTQFDAAKQERLAKDLSTALELKTGGGRGTEDEECSKNRRPYLNAKWSKDFGVSQEEFKKGELLAPMFLQLIDFAAGSVLVDCKVNNEGCFSRRFFIETFWCCYRWWSYVPFWCCWWSW
jgi:hypothetical protein